MCKTYRMAKSAPMVRNAKWVVRHAAVIGVVLSLLCRLLPQDYRVLCHELAQLCFPS